VEFAKEMDDVVISKSHAFLCTESGQNEIIKDINEKKLTTIVASA
jgi:heterodisulfide reductase subunit A-like polyferredoxin